MPSPHHQKEAVITFKADSALLDALKNIPNRSEFIREAILAALDNSCPLCHGSGVLTPNQKRHWDSFTETHKLRECGDCHEIHLVCPGTTEPDTTVTHGTP
ncbi:MAG: CopG family transcriptional regulator [Phycisphaerales bacterium]|nr:CopG family transcriptional regulator [Phycisphaerales bacterium]